MTAEVITIPTDAALWARYCKALDRWKKTRADDARAEAEAALAEWARAFYQRRAS